MANKYANLVGTNKIKDEYTKINTGFDRVEVDINKLETDVTAVNTRVGTIITTPISGQAATQEIVDARVSAVKSKTFATLDARLEETEQDVATHKADNAYIAPTLLNGWENFGSSYITAGYIKDAHGYVYLRGFIKSGATAINTILFNLPGGYRPGAQHLFPQVSKGATTAIQINVDGNVLLGASTTSADWLSLSGIVFKAGG
jgi:hypothetical protein